MSVVLAFISGVASIVRDGERSRLVFLCAAFGLFVLVFLLGEILMPH